MIDEIGDNTYAAASAVHFALEETASRSLFFFFDAAVSDAAGVVWGAMRGPVKDVLIEEAHRIASHAEKPQA